MTPTRVLVVDDSVVIRRLVSQALDQDPDIEVVGYAPNGRLALTKVTQLVPDLITMDIEMPEMNGIEAVRALRAAGRTMPIIMFSTLTERGAAATMEALAAGATDYVTKPTGAHSVQESLERVAAELVPKVHALVPRARTRRTVTAAAPAGGPTPLSRGPVRLAARPAASSMVRAVVIGSSTGGPAALSTVLEGLAAALPVPVLVVQHMPPVFTRQLADRLDRIGPTTVTEAGEGDALRPGCLYVAPGDRHLEVTGEPGRARTTLTDGPPVNYCRPAVDVLFRSAVRVYGGALLAVVLTGMGSDGRAGAGEVVTAGGTVLVQDEASSVVWGMPGAVATAGYAHEIAPLSGIADAVVRLVRESAR